MLYFLVVGFVREDPGWSQDSQLLSYHEQLPIQEEIRGPWLGPRAVTPLSKPGF